MIFNDVNIDIKGGNFACFLGQSGSGKSTLLRLIAGLEKPTRGTIEVGGSLVKKPQLDKGIVFQDYGLYPWMKAGKNITIALEQKYPDWSKEEREEHARSILAESGLKDEVFDMYPKQLSGGMRQRCAIARAFAIDPPLLLMDEPFGALDAVTRATLQDMLLELWQKANPKKTVIFITHDVDEALLLAEEIYVIGQAGNDVVFHTHVSKEQRANRQGIDSEETSKLRSELVYQINKDVTTMME